MEWLIPLIWSIIALIILGLALGMLVAIGAFSGVLLLVAVGLFTAGFHVYSLGFESTATGAWIGSVVFLILGLATMGFFIKLLFIQWKREKWDDWLKGNFSS